MNKIGHLCVASVATIPIFYNMQIDTSLFDTSYIIDFVNQINKMNDILYYQLTQNKFYYPIIFLAILCLGVNTPDLDLYIGDPKKRYKTHRQITHSLLLFIVLLSIVLFYNRSFYEYKDLYYIYLYGIFTHLIADVITGTIPMFLYGAYYQPNKILLRIGIDTFFPFKSKTFENMKKSIVLFFDKIGLYIFLPFVLIIIIQTILRLNNKSIF